MPISGNSIKKSDYFKPWKLIVLPHTESSNLEYIDWNGKQYYISFTLEYLYYEPITARNKSLNNKNSETRAHL